TRRRSSRPCRMSWMAPRVRATVSAACSSMGISRSSCSGASSSLVATMRKSSVACMSCLTNLCDSLIGTRVVPWLWIPRLRLRPGMYSAGVKPRDDNARTLQLALHPSAHFADVQGERMALHLEVVLRRAGFGAQVRAQRFAGDVVAVALDGARQRFVGPIAQGDAVGDVEADVLARLLDAVDHFAGQAFGHQGVVQRAVHVDRDETVGQRFRARLRLA